MRVTKKDKVRARFPGMPDDAFNRLWDKIPPELKRQASAKDLVLLIDFAFNLWLSDCAEVD